MSGGLREYKKGGRTYEIEDPSGGCIFDHHHRADPAVYVAVVGLSSYQTQSFRKEYGLTEQVDLFSGNSLQIFNRLTKRYQEEIRQTLKDDPGLYEDDTYLNNLNEELKSHYAYLIVLKGGRYLSAGAMTCRWIPLCMTSCPISTL